VIYGHAVDPLSITVNEKEMLSVLHAGAHVVEVAVDGAVETCLVKDLQFGWLGDNVIHVDFARVNLDEEVTIHVHLNFIGVPPALKAGSTLQHDHTEMTVRCKVRDIPSQVRIDLGKMEGNHLVAGDVALPAGVTLAMDPHSPICTVSFVREVAAAPAAEAAEGAAAAAPEVLSAKDKDKAAPASEAPKK